MKKATFILPDEFQFSVSEKEGKLLLEENETIKLSNENLRVIAHWKKERNFNLKGHKESLAETMAFFLANGIETDRNNNALVGLGMLYLDLERFE